MVQSIYQEQDAVAGQHCRNDDSQHEEIHPTFQHFETLPKKKTIEVSRMEVTHKERKERIQGFCYLDSRAGHVTVCDGFSPVNILLVVERNQTNVHPAKRKQGHQEDD